VSLVPDRHNRVVTGQATRTHAWGGTGREARPMHTVPESAVDDDSRKASCCVQAQENSVGESTSAADSASLLCSEPPKEALETSLHFYDLESYDSRRRRHQVMYALLDAADAAEMQKSFEHADVARKEAGRIEGCCEFAILAQADDTGKPCVLILTCKCRLCPTCQHHRTSLCAAKTRHAAKQMEDMRFLTLTIKHSQTPLRDQVKKLCGAFAKLRRSQYWKAHTKGGIYTLEITYNPGSDEFHPHIHALIDGDWMDHQVLKNMWEKITGDSKNLRIERPKSTKAIERYICKYISKNIAPDNIPPHRLAEYVASIKSWRMIQSFGHIKMASDEELKMKDRPTFTHIMELHVLRHFAKSGNLVAASLLEAWRNLIWAMGEAPGYDLVECTKSFAIDQADRCPISYYSTPPPDSALDLFDSQSQSRPYWMD